MLARHPNKRQLSLWLDGQAPNYDSHVDECEQCSALLEDIVGIDLDNDDSKIRPALLVLLEPPADLEDRVSRRIADRLQTTSDMELFSSLFGIPIDAARIFLEPPKS